MRNLILAAVACLGATGAASAAEYRWILVCDTFWAGARGMVVIGTFATEEACAAAAAKAKRLSTYNGTVCLDRGVSAP